MKKNMLVSFFWLFGFMLATAGAQEVDWSVVGASKQAKIEVNMPSIEGYGTKEVELKFRLLSTQTMEKKGLRYDEEHIKIKMSCDSYMLKQTQKQWFLQGKLLKTVSKDLYDIDVRHKDNLMFSLVYQLACENYIKEKKLSSPISIPPQEQIEEILNEYVQEKK